MAAKHWDYKRIIIEINHAPRAEQDRDAWFLYYGQKSTTDWKDAEIEALGRDG